MNPFNGVATKSSIQKHRHISPPLHINEIVGWACGRNISPRKQAMDFVVMGLFEIQETLSAFLTHPNHQQGVMKWQKIASGQVLGIGSDTTKFVGLLDGWADFGVT
ncbi:Dabb family protein [Pseudomonas brassicacearum]|uniref:Dabb family protein n=1 Tax=Pseudomonas brassicacearum TaxID=930166 RepID=UPI00223A7F7E|nr:Dabb family protein [Pseudomonas brassicacearum]